VPFVGCAINDKDGLLTATLCTIAFPDADGDGAPDRAQLPLRGESESESGRHADDRDRRIDDRVVRGSRHRVPGGGGSVRCEYTTITNNRPGTFSVGATVTCSTRPRGRTARCSQTVTVVDTTDPVFTFVPGPP
jgi:hypothetical protein